MSYSILEINVNAMSIIFFWQNDTICTTDAIHFRSEVQTGSWKHVHVEAEDPINILTKFRNDRICSLEDNN